MSRSELVDEVKRAVEVAREALERDAAEARARGRASSSPDTASVATLAAGILVRSAIERGATDREELAQTSDTLRTLSEPAALRARARQRRGRARQVVESPQSP